MNKIFMLLAMMLIPPSAMAQESMEQKGEPKRALCDVIKTSKGAAYRAGVDVNGNAVTPADLNTPAMALPDVIKIPLEFNLAQRLSALGVNTLNNTRSVGALGTVDVYMDGRVEFNGEDITQRSRALCGLPYVETREVAVEAPAPVIETAAPVPKIEAKPLPLTVKPRLESEQEVVSEFIAEPVVKNVSTPPDLDEPPFKGKLKSELKEQEIAEQIAEDMIEEQIIDDAIFGQDAQDFDYNN